MIVVRGGFDGVGAWNVLAFDNDHANDWAYDLDGVSDLSLVESSCWWPRGTGPGGDEVLEEELSVEAAAEQMQEREP
jgi:hypothetical protein